MPVKTPDTLISENKTASAPISRTVSPSNNTYASRTKGKVLEITASSPATVMTSLSSDSIALNQTTPNSSPVTFSDGSSHIDHLVSNSISTPDINVNGNDLPSSQDLPLSQDLQPPFTPPTPIPLQAMSYSYRSQQYFHQRPFYNPANTTNLYIRGLPVTVTDQFLRELCEPFGTIMSSKAIVDQKEGFCKGYGFVMYGNIEESKRAITELGKLGYQVSFAKESFSTKLKNLGDPESANLYISNLPMDMDEEQLVILLQPFEVLSTRILLQEGKSKGVGFARVIDRSSADSIIEKLNGVHLPNAPYPLQVRIADSVAQKKLKNQNSRKRGGFRPRIITGEYNSGISQHHQNPHHHHHQQSMQQPTLFFAPGSPPMIESTNSQSNNPGIGSTVHPHHNPNVYPPNHHAAQYTTATTLYLPQGNSNSGNPGNPGNPGMNVGGLVGYPPLIQNQSGAPSGGSNSPPLHTPLDPLSVGPTIIGDGNYPTSPPASSIPTGGQLTYYPYGAGLAPMAVSHMYPMTMVHHAMVTDGVPGTPTGSTPHAFYMAPQPSIGYYQPPQLGPSQHQQNSNSYRSLMYNPSLSGNVSMKQNDKNSVIMMTHGKTQSQSQNPISTDTMIPNHPHSQQYQPQQPQQQ